LQHLDHLYVVTRLQRSAHQLMQVNPASCSFSCFRKAYSPARISSGLEGTEVGVMVPGTATASSGTVLYVYGGGRTPATECDIICELRAWTCFKIRIRIDNYAQNKSSAPLKDLKGTTETHTKSRDTITQTGIAPRYLPQYLVSFEVSFPERAFSLFLNTYII
jgi:hypothetical protein